MKICILIEKHEEKRKEVDFMMRKVLTVLRRILWGMAQNMFSQVFAVWWNKPERSVMVNDKLNLKPNSIWSVLIAGAAVIVCAAIDAILEEESNESISDQTRK